MKLHLSLNAPNTGRDSYIQETSLCNSIITGGVLLFLSSVITVGVMAGFCAYSLEKKEAVTVSNPTGQNALSENSTKRLYVVQSAYLEVRP